MREETGKESRMIAGKTKVALGQILSANQQIFSYIVRIFPCRFHAASLFIRIGNNFQSSPCSMLAVQST